MGQRLMPYSNMGLAPIVHGYGTNAYSHSNYDMMRHAPTVMWQYGTNLLSYKAVSGGFG